MTDNFDEAATDAQSDGDRLEAELRRLTWALGIIAVLAVLFLAGISAACYFFIIPHGA